MLDELMEEEIYKGRAIDRTIWRAGCQGPAVRQNTRKIFSVVLICT